MFLGLRTVIYPAPDLEAAKAWFTGVLGIEPYFEQPFYVGFNVAGYELGLDPNSDVANGPTTYWGVADVAVALQSLLDHGATVHSPVADVGDGIRVASVREPSGSVLAIIENPHFVLSAAVATSYGPGR